MCVLLHSASRRKVAPSRMSSNNEQQAAVAKMRDQFAAAQKRRRALPSVVASPEAPAPHESGPTDRAVAADLPQAAALRPRGDPH